MLKSIVIDTSDETKKGWNNLLDKKRVLVARNYIMDENPNIKNNALVKE